MADDSDGTILQSSAEGFVAIHADRPTRPFVASPATDQTFNVLGLDVVPIACLHLGDILFEFDSSFIRADAAKVLLGLPALRQSRANSKGDLPPVSIFGHADPVGKDDYNKQLSGRRATAVFGLLTHNVDIWQRLFNQPFGGDDWSKNASVTGLRASLGIPPGTSRADVFAAYMAGLFPDPLTPGDFLGRGQDPNGRADFQGCSSFNPLIILSKEDNATLTKEQRNAANLLDRRVVVYLFRPGLFVQSSLWPCPAAKDGPEGCHKRFFLDAAQRRAPGDERREHTKVTDNTFACRFYDRIGGASPCERILKMYRIRLFDRRANPLPAAPFFITDGKTKFIGRAQADAFVTLRDLKVPTTVVVKWNRPAGGDTPGSPPPKETDQFEFMLNVFVDIDDSNRTQAALNRLHNLGYVAGPQQEDDVRQFQKHYQDRFGLQINGQLDKDTQDALETVNNECDLVVKTEVPSGG